MVRSIFGCMVMALPLVFLIASTTTTATVELPGHRCYDFANNGTRYGCDGDRCCSFANYCGNTPYYCAVANCAFQCPPPPPPIPVMLSSSTTNVTTVVKVMRNNYYDRDHRISSDNRTVAVALLSCANSLKNLSLASLHKYPWASNFHVNNYTTTCGHCLKLTNIKSGVKAMVRVVHERATSTESDQGLELGTATFNKLKADQEDRHIAVVKYNFENCD